MRSRLTPGRVASHDVARPAGRRLAMALAVVISSGVLVGCSAFGSDDSKTATKNASQIVETPTSAGGETPVATTVASVVESTVPPVTWTTVAPGLAPPQLEVIDLELGTGETVGAGSTILVNYVAHHYFSGEQFESTIGKAPKSIRLGSQQAIPGWELGLIGMQEGGRRELVVPAELAFGNDGNSVVGPNEAIVYAIDLVKVIPPVASAEIPLVSVDPGLAPTELGIVDELVGDGSLAAAGSAVSVRYILLSATTGKQVYSGWETGALSQFTLGSHEVVAGLEQGVAGMKIGGRRRLEVPASLAYGETGSPGGEVQPGEPVVYLVELVSAN